MIQKIKHRIQFPKDNFFGLKRDETCFYLQEAEQPRKKIRFHDYSEIYRVPGLYEQLFYDRLKCSSPNKVTAILQSALDQSEENLSELRVLDLGAGNGMMGEELKKHGVSRLVGVDIIEEAHDATIRDRPDLYDAYSRFY
jgi:predicted TPR repeat methyltransferase